MPTDKGVWVLAEQREGELQEVTLQLMNEGRGIADKLGDELSAILVGSDLKRLGDSPALRGAEKVYLIDSQPLLAYSSELYAGVLSALVSEQRPKILLCGATWIGRDLSVRLAAKLKTGLVSDCVSLDLSEEGLLLQTKPAYGGKVNATVICPSARPQIATIKPGIVETRHAKPAKRPEVITISPEVDASRCRTRMIGFLPAKPGTVSLDEAEIIVAGGRGMGGSEGFRHLEELAEVLGGSVGATRVPVDEGWVPFERQIGQTGKTVSPKLYVACGISGSIYHTAGISGSRITVAVNTDRNAPIFKMADVGAVGDVLQVIPALNRRLHEILATHDASGVEGG